MLRESRVATVFCGGGNSGTFKYVFKTYSRDVLPRPRLFMALYKNHLLHKRCITNDTYIAGVASVESSVFCKLTYIV